MIDKNETNTRFVIIIIIIIIIIVICHHHLNQNLFKKCVVIEMYKLTR